MLGWEIGSVSLSFIMIMKAVWANQLTLLGTIPHYVRQVLYFPKVAVTKVESRFQPLRGDPDNPLKGKKAICQARNPQARPSGPARKKNFHWRFSLRGDLDSSSYSPKTLS